jgi:hypothetical protein
MKNPCDFFSRLWNWVELLYIFFNSWFSLLVIINSDDEDWAVFRRTLGSFLSLIVFVKTLYYLKMVESLAQHIDVIFKIINSIKFFLVVFLICLISFSNSFYLLGRNQIQYDKENIPFDLFPDYSTFLGSLWTVFGISIGDSEADPIFLG